MAVNATAVWRVRPSGGNTNGGGYDAAISGAGTDYSQQNAAQLSVTDAASTAATSVVTSVTGGFTAAMVGNAMYLSGTHFTTGWYFITVRTDTNTVTVDRDPTTGGNGSGGTCNVGGGWAEPFTNTTSSGPLVPGNACYILGSGVPTPSSYTFDYTTTVLWTSAAGDATNGQITFAADPATPSYTGNNSAGSGMPTIRLSATNSLVQLGAYATYLVIFVIATHGSALTFGQMASNNQGSVFKFCCFDETDNDYYCVVDNNVGNSNNSYIGCEFFSSTGGAGSNTKAALNLQGANFLVSGCNIHDWAGGGVITSGGNSGGEIENTIIAKTGGDGVALQQSANRVILSGLTIDGNSGHGVNVSSTSVLSVSSGKNLVITNQVGAGKSGIKIGSGAAAANSLVARFWDYNQFFNNTANYSGINAAAHDVALLSNPYVNQSTEDYTPV